MDGLRRTNCRYKKARIAGFQDFVSGSGDHLQRILVGWRELNPHPKVFNIMKLKMFIIMDIYA